MPATDVFGFGDSYPISLQYSLKDVAAVYPKHHMDFLNSLPISPSNLASD